MWDPARPWGVRVRRVPLPRFTGKVGANKSVRYEPRRPFAGFEPSSLIRGGIRKHLLARSSRVRPLRDLSGYMVVSFRVLVKRRRRRLLLTTKIEEKAIAPPAIRGLR